MAKLVAGEDNPFDTAMTGVRMQPVCFGSRKCDPNEEQYHSYVDESAAGRWAIGKLKRFLYGCHFFWLWDCDAIKDLLNYNGPIQQLKCWAQELLGYHFTVLHCANKVMKDVDALNRRYGDKLIAQYMVKSAALHTSSLKAHPESYIVCSLHYLIRKLSAAPPPPTDLHASERMCASTHLLTSSPPVMLPSSSTTAAFVPPTKSEISLNQLVQVSLQAKIITWASIGAGFPMIHWALSHVCNDFDFQLLSAFPSASDDKLSRCFPGTSIRQKVSPVLQSLDSEEPLSVAKASTPPPAPTTPHHKNYGYASWPFFSCENPPLILLAGASLSL
jgi:hypothetical protein